MSRHPARPEAPFVAAAAATASAARFLAAAAFSMHRVLLTGPELAFVAGNQPASWQAVGDGLRPVAWALVRAAARLPVSPELAWRVPGIAASLITLACVYVFVRAFGSRVAAWCAVLFDMAADAFGSASDARGYAIAGAVAALALVCWQRADGRRSVGWSIGLGVLAALAVALHRSGAVVVLAIAAAAVVRAIARRRLEIGVLAALAPALSGALLLILPAARRAITAAAAALMTHPGAAIKQPAYALAHVQSAYGGVFGIVVPFVLVLLGSLIFLQHRPGAAERERSPNAASWTELAAPAALALGPVWAYTPVLLRGDRLSPADVLPVAAGSAILLGAWADTLAASGRVRRTWIASLALAAAANLFWHDSQSIRRSDLVQERGPFALLRWRAALEASLPIVIPDRDVYLQLAHYLPPTLAGRVTYVASRAELETFLHRTPAFYVFEAAEVRGPLIVWLAARHPHIERLASWSVPTDLSRGPAHLYRVALPRS